jgi:hypothetical protein
LNRRTQRVQTRAIAMGINLQLTALNAWKPRIIGLELNPGG